jgi:DNA-binding transcriptional LysR family regulator
MLGDPVEVPLQRSQAGALLTRWRYHQPLRNLGANAYTPGMIEKLEFILALARERHFGHAAEACGVSQPTLSAGIKQLEDSFGVLLVQRGSRFQGFTPEGERVLDWARRIVGDTRAMHQEIDALKRGLAGHIRIAAIPTALAMVAMLTTPYRAKHPSVSFTIWSRNSIEVLGQLENLEVDAGLTYLDNEPLGRVQTVPLYSEQYRLLISSDAPLGNRDSVTWAEVGSIPLCLLTPDMQNRRIIEGLLREAGADVAPTLESDSIVVLFAHVRTGRWASVMPAKLASALGLTDTVRAIPIVEPEVSHSIGLVVPERNPLTPLINALVSEAKQLAPLLSVRSEIPIDR